MRWKSHVRFGERVGETDQPRGWHRAPARLHSLVRLPVMVVVVALLMVVPLLSCTEVRRRRSSERFRSGHPLRATRRGWAPDLARSRSDSWRETLPGAPLHLPCGPAPPTLSGSPGHESVGAGCAGRAGGWTETKGLHGDELHRNRAVRGAISSPDPTVTQTPCRGSDRSPPWPASGRGPG